MTGRRPRFSYANVVATLTALVVLVGGTAYAANQLAKNSVGKKQLKAKSVTTAKIKKNAVTTAKIKKSAVTGAKVKAGSIADVDLSASVPFGRIVGKVTATTAQTLPVPAAEEFAPYPGALSYTQEAGRTDTYAGVVDFNVSDSCEVAQVVFALLAEPANPAEISPFDFAKIVGFGAYLGGPGTQRVNLGPYPGGGVSGAPASALGRSFTLTSRAQCKAGGEGVTITGVAVDVIGVR